MYVTRLKICLISYKSNILLLQFCIRVTFFHVTLRPCLLSSNSPVTLWSSLFHPNWPVCVPRVIVPASGEHVQLSIFLFLCPHVRDDKWVRGERIKSPKWNAKTNKNPSTRISFTHLWMAIARKRIQLDVRIWSPPNGGEICERPHVQMFCTLTIMSYFCWLLRMNRNKQSSYANI